jgi:hypothetical protein
MSSLIYAMEIKLAVSFDIQFVMPNVQRQFSEYVRRVINDKGLSYREVSWRAKKKGYDISHTTVGDIINKPEKDVRRETLKALAAGLEVDEDEVIAIAFGKVPKEVRKFREGMMTAMLDGFGKLSDKDQKVILPYLEMVKREIDRLLPK